MNLDLGEWPVMNVDDIEHNGNLRRLDIIRHSK